MYIASSTLRRMFLMGLFMGVLTAPGMAAQENDKLITLPRSFQGARLGMTLSALVTAVPDVNRASLNRREVGQRTIVARSKDRHVQRVEYRFYENRLREMAIYYKGQEMPGGYSRLRDRLRKAYGEPVVEDQKEDYERGLYRVSVTKTIWEDGATMSSVAEAYKVIDEDHRDLIVTITDLDLQRAFEQDQERRRQQQELNIPIPLPDQGEQGGQTAMARPGGPHNIRKLNQSEQPGYENR